jgi:hypothetical protein
MAGVLIILLADNYILPEFHDLFHSLPSGGQQEVYQIVTAKFKCHPKMLLELPESADPNKRLTIENSNEPGEVLLTYIPNAVMKNDGKKIANAFWKMVSEYPAAPGDEPVPNNGVPVHYAKDRDLQRTGHKPAWHIGCWETYGSTPRITKESWNQHPIALGRLNGLLEQIRQNLAPHFVNIVRRYFPEQADFMIK